MSATGLAITNPLVKYRALVATNAIRPDNGQLRLAVHLQKLYERLKDYEPQVEYSRRLNQISRDVNSKENGSAENGARDAALPKLESWRTLLTAKERADSLALTRRLNPLESALEIDSPRGLMLHGEVGTGKSMLIDLFADCLPTRKKRRWHFNTFMLETFARLESLRRSRSMADDEYSLLWLAREMIQTHPILFLDEFQMPDRVASKILCNLMTSFFHLGGVLVATSNRMPEELAKASGIEFAPPPSRLQSLGWRMGLSGRPRTYAQHDEFAAFLEVLKARCEVWEIEGGTDWRRIESKKLKPKQEEEAPMTEQWRVDGHEDLQHAAGMAGWPVKDTANGLQHDSAEGPELPKYYTSITLDQASGQRVDEQVLQQAIGAASVDSLPFNPSTLNVYGRTIKVPRSWNGISEWKFSELCQTTLGPADYITLASTYHTLILRDVPILTWHMKNEARRFITLLDALYECKCKLLIVNAAAGPDDLFFPEKEAQEDSDAVYSETFSEIHQDATAPFRPNILTDNPNYAEPDAEPDYTHARLAGLLNADALEDDPPNKPQQGKNPFGRSFGRTDSEMERRPVDPDEPRYSGRLDFSRASQFTGEDERFAYKRAQSRLWELCSARWWARTGDDWHRPLPVEVRRWERSLSAAISSTTATLPLDHASSTDVHIGDAVVDESRDQKMFKHGASPFRTATEPPPRFSWTHIWGTMKWGPKAGPWGQGVEGLKDRKREGK